jgi:RNase P subunit RPR2
MMTTPTLNLCCHKCNEREAVEIMYGHGGAVIHVKCLLCGWLSFFQRGRADARLGAVEDSAS